MVGRTPLPGQSHPGVVGNTAGPTAPRPFQAQVAALGHERVQLLVRNVANLRGLVRIKIEDNGDLALDKKALDDAKLVFDNVWAQASELPEGSPGIPEESSWPPCPEEDPALDKKVVVVLQKLRCID